MKWLVVLGFLVFLARSGESGALKCTPGADVLCPIGDGEKKQTPEIKDILKDSGGNKDEVECLAGSEWESNCHRCRCLDSGLAECKRQDNCEGGSYGEPIKCKPKSSFLRECNTCVCLENGLGLCTEKYCQKTKDTILKKENLRPGKDCEPGTFWKSRCNDCGCSPEGNYYCTEKACPDQESEPIMRCAPDSMWKYECNKCWCTSDGRAICTRMGCDNGLDVGANNFTSDPKPEEISKVIEDNEVGYNEHKVWKRSVCKPNQIFQSECNSCKCAANGQSYRCTQNECMEGDMNKEVEVFMEDEGVDHIERHSVCKPRATFYIGCNTCHCNQDGSDYSCTNKPCPLPEDVELFHELKEVKPIVPFSSKDEYHDEKLKKL